jgi:hypothetical protein
VYRGIDRVTDLTLSEQGKELIFTTNSQARVMPKEYLKMSGVGGAPVNKSTFIRPEGRCSQSRYEITHAGHGSCSEEVTLVYERADCSQRLVLVKNKLYSLTSRLGREIFINNPCSLPAAIEYWLNGEQVLALPFSETARQPLDYASEVFLNQIENYGFSPDGRQHVIVPGIWRVYVGNNGAWIGVAPTHYYVNGLAKQPDERVGGHILAGYINAEGTAFIIEGNRGFITNTGILFDKKDREFFGESIKIDIVSTTAYHYYFTMKK